MFRRVIAGLILGPALLIGSFAWSGYLALRTVFDEDRSRDVAEELLENPEVRAQLAENLGAALEAALPDAVAISDDQVERTATAVLDDPRVTELVLEAFGSTHRAFLGQGDAPETLDLSPVAAVARERLLVFAPEAAAALPESSNLTVELPTEKIPDSSPVKTFLETTVPFLAGISVVMILMAFVTTSDRPSVLKRAARWALGTTVVYLVIGFGVPALLRFVFPEQAEVLAALITALLRTTLVPSIALAAAGVVLLLAAWAWPDGGRRKDRSPDSERAPDAVPAAMPAAPAAPPKATPPPRAATAPPTAATTAIRAQSAQSAQPSAPEPAPAPLPASPAPPPAPRPEVIPPAEPTSPPAGTPPSPPAPAPVDAGGPPPFRPTLPTRADRATTPMVSADPDQVSPDPAPTPAVEPPTPPDPRDTGPKWLPPTWNPEYGWVLDSADERPPPENARWVEGVGYVVPGPPPEGS